MSDGMEPAARGRAVLLVVVGVALGVFVGWLLFAHPGTSRDDGASGPSVWFGDLTDPPELDEATADATLRALAATLLGGSARPLVLPKALTADTGPQAVFLSLGDGQQRARVFQGSGLDLAAALRAAVAQATNPAVDRTGFHILTLDVVESVDDLGSRRLDDALRFVVGTHGLAFSRETATAFLPGEVLANALVDRKVKLRPGRIVNTMTAAGRPNRVTVAALLDEGPLRVYRFTTRTLHWDGGQVVSLFRGHRRFAQLDPAMLLAAARAGGRYLVDNVDPNGRFVYAYAPASDRADDDYNILRHAGTTYALLELYEAEADAALLAAARRALDYLIRAVQPGSENGTAIVVEENEAKLGGNGLAAIALAKYIQVTGDETFKPLLVKLGRWIESVQAETGEFEVHKLYWPAGLVADFESTYYPGEALLALARIHAVDPQAHWLDAAERGARWLIEVRDGELASEDLPADHWLLYALNEIHAARPKAAYVVHALRIAATILAAQNLEPHRPDWLGSYYRPPRSTPTATRSEGLVAAWHLARRAEKVAVAKRILPAIERGVGFQLRTQARPETALYLRRPSRALGGFHKSLTDLEIRIDYVQHNLSALLGLRRILQ